MEVVTVKLGTQTADAYLVRGVPWIRVPSLGHILGCGENTIRTIYSRHKEWFGPDETTIMSLPTDGGPQDVRVFSPVGAALIAVFSRKRRAVPVKTALMRLATGRQVPQLPDGRPARAGRTLSVREAEMLDYAISFAEPGTKIESVLKGLRSGAIVPEANPALARLVEQYVGAAQMMSESRRVFSQINRQARDLGYEPQAVKRLVEARAALNGGDPQLPFDVQDVEEAPDV